LACLLIFCWFIVRLGIGWNLHCTPQYTSGFLIDQLDRKTINRHCFLVATASVSYINAVSVSLLNLLRWMVDIWFKAMAEVYFESLKVPSCY